MAVEVLQQTQVTLDVLLDKTGRGPVFEAVTLGRRWNGWATPYFTREEGQRVVEAFGGRLKAWHDAEADAFRFVDQDGEEEAFHVMDLEGLRVYPIGTSVWTWDDDPEQVLACLAPGAIRWLEELEQENHGGQAEKTRLIRGLRTALGRIEA